VKWKLKKIENNSATKKNAKREREREKCVAKSFLIYLVLIRPILKICLVVILLVVYSMVPLIKVSIINLGNSLLTLFMM
jgi:hypothetical protein